MPCGRDRRPWSNRLHSSEQAGLKGEIKSLFSDELNQHAREINQDVAQLQYEVQCPLQSLLFVEADLCCNARAGCGILHGDK